MNTIKITDTNHPNFSEAWALYEQAFPLVERRLMKFQTLIMTHPNYHFEVVFHNEHFLGILFWWGFNDLRYVEHFATLPAHRGRGFGKKILETFIKKDSTPIVLEVELPDNEIEKRRIQFYERIGFHLTNYYYEQPSYNEEDFPLQLRLMSYPSPLTVDELNHFIDDYHPVVSDLSEIQKEKLNMI